MSLQLHDWGLRVASVRINRFRKLCITATLAGCVGLSAFASESHAAIIALFTFNDMGTNNDGTTAVTIDNAVGTPTLTLVEDSGSLVDQNGQVGTSFTDAEGTMHSGTTSAFPAAAWTNGTLNTSTDPNDYWLLELDTTGYRDLMLRFDYRLTSSGSLLGPTQVTMEWAVGAGPYNLIQTFELTRNNAYNEFALDLSGIDAIENVTAVRIRGTWSNDGSTTSTTIPSVRMDNLQLTGVPEPATIALALCAAISLLARPRR